MSILKDIVMHVYATILVSFHRITQLTFQGHGNVRQQPRALTVFVLGQAMLCYAMLCYNGKIVPCAEVGLQKLVHITYLGLP